MKVIRNLVLILLFAYLAAYLYTYDPFRDAHIRDQIEKIKASKDKKLKSLDKSYKECGGLHSSGKHSSGNYSIEFFHPSCRSYNFHCKDTEYCGMPPNPSHYDCKENVDCEVIVLITDKHNDTVLKGVGALSAPYPNGEIFGDVVKLQKMPEDFPYLVLKSTRFGSWGSGYSYHLYSTEDKFKKIIKIGPSYKGFYKDAKGNYIIDIQQDYWPEFGNNSDRLTNEISYRLTSNEEYQSTGNVFAIDMDAIKARVVSFSDKEIARLMAYAKQSNKKIIKAFDSEKEWYYFWTPNSTSEKWPLQLLRIRESDPSKGYAYGDLFNLARNGRIDLAKKYFDILIPNRYNEYTAILPESLNTKEKLWKGYLHDLQEQGRRTRESSSPISFPDKSTKKLHWQIFNL